MARTFHNFVNGEAVDGSEGRTTDIVNPATGECYATAPLSGPADIDAAMRAAATAFESWKETTPSERSLALFRIADAVEARADELIALEVENCGKPAHLTRSEEIPPMVDQIRFFAGAARHLEGKSAGEFLPPGVLNVVCGDRDTGRAMVTHDAPAMVSVTGSVRAGMEVAAAASTTLKRCHLE